MQPIPVNFPNPPATLSARANRAERAARAPSPPAQPIAETPHPGPAPVAPSCASTAQEAASPLAIDLFCGAGGLSIAFHREKFKIVAAVDNDRAAMDTYTCSFVNAHSPATVPLLATVPDPDLAAKLHTALAGRRLDVLLGGPPCQDFSIARMRKKRRSERMGLVQHYLDLVAELRPRAFLFENVPGLKMADDGEHWRNIKTIAAGMGYAVFDDQLAAEDFGVPQRRSRLFVVGLDADLAGSFRFPEPSGERRTVDQTIGHLPKLAAGESDPSDPDHRARAHTAEIVQYIASIPEGGAWRDASATRVLKCHEGHKGHYDVYGRVRAGEIAPTMTGGCTNPSRGRFIHPAQHRGLTVREAALLQTFPEDWHFKGGVEKASQQVGNAVPVELGRALARSLMAALGGQSHSTLLQHD